MASTYKATVFQKLDNCFELFNLTKFSNEMKFYNFSILLASADCVNVVQKSTKKQNKDKTGKG